MKIAVFSEDKYCKPIQILSKKVLGEQSDVIIRYKKRWDLFKEEKVYSYIAHDILQEHPDIFKVIICVDSECTPEEETQRGLRRLERSIKGKIKYPIYCVVITHALEGWLLADPDAIKEYLSSRAKVKIPAQATLDCEPKGLMKDIFRKAAKEFLPSRDNPRIAEKIEIKKIAKRNRSFAHFREKIKDP